MTEGCCCCEDFRCAFSLEVSPIDSDLHPSSCSFGSFPSSIYHHDDPYYDCVLSFLCSFYVFSPISPFLPPSYFFSSLGPYVLLLSPPSQTTHERKVEKKFANQNVVREGSKKGKKEGKKGKKRKGREGKGEGRMVGGGEEFNRSQPNFIGDKLKGLQKYNLIALSLQRIDSGEGIDQE